MSSPVRPAILGLLAVVAALAAAYGWLQAGGSERRSGERVLDDARLLSPAQRERVARHHAYLLSAFDIDYRVVTSRGVVDLDRSAVELLREAGRDSASRSGRALLLLIDVAADRVRLEVGYPLEGAFPDAFVDYVERRQMVPFFEAGRVADGILATTELIVTRAARDAEGFGTALEAWTASSGGAGAANEARLGAGPAERVLAPASGVQPGAAPADTLMAYRRAMAGHDADPDLPIYTAQTRRMLAGRLVTPAQMDNAVSSLAACSDERTLYSDDGGHAVIRFPIDARDCPPYFLRAQAGVWQLDLASMGRSIRFGASNAWHLTPEAASEYRFGFRDWRFDRNGYPQGSRSVD